MIPLISLMKKRRIAVSLLISYPGDIASGRTSVLGIVPQYAYLINWPHTLVLPIGVVSPNLLLFCSSYSAPLPVLLVPGRLVFLPAVH
jgi:hypothetical protein